MAKIVVLDDEPVTCETIKRWLLAEGHDVRAVQTGPEAIDLGYLFEPDVLVTDLRLTCDYDGIEVAEAFRFANKKIKTILITAYSIAAIKKQAEAANIIQAMMKPVSRSQLATAVEQALTQEKYTTMKLVS